MIGYTMETLRSSFAEDDALLITGRPSNEMISENIRTIPANNTNTNTDVPSHDYNWVHNDWTFPLLVILSIGYNISRPSR